MSEIPSKLRLWKKISQSDEFSTRKLYGYNKLLFFEPHETQRDFMSSSAKIRLFLGGNRSGKTTSGVVEVLWLCLGIHPWHQKWEPPIYARICCTDFRNGIQKIIIPKIKEYLPEYSYKFDKENLTFTILDNGSQIELMSYEQDVSKFGGTARHIVHMDEEPTSYAIWLQNLMRTADYGGILIMTMTPIEQTMTWTYEEIYQRWEEGQAKDVDVFQCGVYDNPYIKNEELKTIENNVREDQKVAILFGDFIPKSARIYPGFASKIHIIDNIVPQEDWTWILAIDPHPRVEQYTLFAGIDRENRVFFFKEYVAHELIKTYATNILDYCKSYNKEPFYSLIDSSARVPDVVTGINIQMAFSDAGIGTVLASKDVEAGIERVRDCLYASVMESKGETWKKGQPIYFSQTGCPITIRQMRNYIWDDFTSATADKHNPKEEPRKKQDHGPDLVRYILNSYPYHAKTFNFKINPNAKHLRRRAGIARI